MQVRENLWGAEDFRVCSDIDEFLDFPDKTSSLSPTPKLNQNVTNFFRFDFFQARLRSPNQNAKKNAKTVQKTKRDNALQR